MDSERRGAAVARLRLALRSALSTAASTEEGVSFIRSLAIARLESEEKTRVKPRSQQAIRLSRSYYSERNDFTTSTTASITRFTCIPLTPSLTLPPPIPLLLLSIACSSAAFSSSSSDPPIRTFSYRIPTPRWTQDCSL